MLNAKAQFVLLFMLFFGVFLLHTQYTDADLFAERNVRGNSFQATSINFLVRSAITSSNIEQLFKTIGLVTSGYDFGAVKIKRDGNVSFKYVLRSHKTNGDDNFCQNLTLTVLKRNLTTFYQGKMLDMSIESSINNDDVTDYIFLVSLDNTASELKNKICEFSFEYKTFRNNPNETGGIYARRVLTNVVSSGTW